MPSQSSSWSKLLVALLLAALAAGGLYYYRKQNEVTPEVSTVTVSRGDVTQAITATGLLQAPTSVDVSSQISGQINEVLVDFNSPVKQGDVLARIDPATYESRLRQARAQLTNAEATFTLARVNTERIRELHTRNLVSQQDRDQAEAQLTQAEANLKIQQANVANAEVDLSRCTIYAPIDGIVLDRQCDVGKTVAASFNAPTLFTLVTDLKVLQINADISEADVGNVALDQEVTFTVDAYPQRTFHGKVRQIRNVPKTSQSVVVYATIIDARNEELKLKPGMTATVSVIVARRPDALRVPNAALRARIPDGFIPKPPVAKDPVSREETKNPAGAAPDSGSAKKPTPAADPAARREQVRQLMREAGISWENGPPSAEAIAKLQKLAAERGIELPDRFSANGKGGAIGATTSRTVYKLTSPLPNLKLEPLRLKIGISDGTYSEVIEGASEGDVIVSGIFVPDSGGGQPSTNPFAPAPVNPGGGGRRF